MIPYQYVVLRCVPRVDRGETINVGIVLYAQATGEPLPDFTPERARR